MSSLGSATDVYCSAGGGITAVSSPPFLDNIREIAEVKDDYTKFHEQFGKCDVYRTVGGSITAGSLPPFLENPHETAKMKGNYKRLFEQVGNDVYRIAGGSITAISMSPFVENPVILLNSRASSGGSLNISRHATSTALLAGASRPSPLRLSWRIAVRLLK